MAKILLVDDDSSLLDVLTMAFADAGHTVVTARDGAVALEQAAREHPDAIVSDVNMQALDGFALCRRLRAAGNPVPIILLTSRDSEIDEALGLELGADDYIPKPFSTRILLARVSALLRRDALRTQTKVASSELLRVGLLTLEIERLEASYKGSPVALTLSEFRLLEALARRPGVVLSRDRLLEIVRGDDSIVVERIIDTYVRRLRRKLEQIDPTFSDIETVVGAGYRLRSR
jgi:DNA-binding response OmpR family regulator